MGRNLRLTSVHPRLLWRREARTVRAPMAPHFPFRSLRGLFLAVGLAALCASLLAGCQCGSQGSDGGTGGGSGGGAQDGGPDAGDGKYDDFPPGPVFDGAPDASVGYFGAADAGASSGGPCVNEPQTGSLVPNDFPRLRFRWTPSAGENLFELRVEAAHQHHPLVVYTSNSTWTMSLGEWTGLALHDADEDISFQVRGLTVSGTTVSAGPSLGTQGTFRIAPVGAGGSIVYWTTSNGTWLKGFKFGEETVHNVAQPSQANAQCIGCHSSTPDGLYAAFSASTQANNGDPSSIGFLSADGTASTPTYISAAAQTLLARNPQQAPVFSKAHWMPGDRVVVTHLPLNGKFELVWTDLEATSSMQGTGWDVVSRNGDTRQAGAAAFAHDGTKLAYMSSASVASGMTTAGDGDIWVVPWGNRQGGSATPLTGASDASFSEYYPTWSDDDAFVAFDRVAAGESSYNNAHAEVFVVPAAGGTAKRLMANDPEACSGASSPGVTNSWPKWSPLSSSSGTKRYYWLTFSSTRLGGKPQLFVSPVVVEGGAMTTYPALYLWNQPAAEANHTPAWDVFQIGIN